MNTFNRITNHFNSHCVHHFVWVLVSSFVAALRLESDRIVHEESEWNRQKLLHTPNSFVANYTAEWLANNSPEHNHKYMCSWYTQMGTTNAHSQLCMTCYGGSWIWAKEGGKRGEKPKPGRRKGEKEEANSFTGISFNNREENVQTRIQYARVQQQHCEHLFSLASLSPSHSLFPSL